MFLMKKDPSCCFDAFLREDSEKGEGSTDLYGEESYVNITLDGHTYHG
jgi:hypothetical protein